MNGMETILLAMRNVSHSIYAQSTAMACRNQAIKVSFSGPQQLECKVGTCLLPNHTKANKHNSCLSSQRYWTSRGICVPMTTKNCFKLREIQPVFAIAIGIAIGICIGICTGICIGICIPITVDIAIATKSYTNQNKP